MSLFALEKDCITDTAPEPRWPAIIALLAVGSLHMALPNSLAVGPRWLLLVVVSLLLIPTVVSHHRGHYPVNHLCGHVLAGVVTAFMVWSLTLLVLALPSHRESPVDLLRSSVSLWITNVLVFALWYWRLDAGGPHARDRRCSHDEGSFLFPQMAMDPEAKEGSEQESWSPHFVDYLFLAFNTSTAFSPTDTAVLSRWAKLLMMIQSSISLAVIALLAARGVNIL